MNATVCGIPSTSPFGNIEDVLSTGALVEFGFSVPFLALPLPAAFPAAGPGAFGILFGSASFGASKLIHNRPIYSQ